MLRHPTGFTQPLIARARDASANLSCLQAQRSYKIMFSRGFIRARPGTKPTLPASGDIWTSCYPGPPGSSSPYIIPPCLTRTCPRSWSSWRVIRAFPPWRYVTATQTNEALPDGRRLTWRPVSGRSRVPDKIRTLKDVNIGSRCRTQPWLS